MKRDGRSFDHRTLEPIRLMAVDFGVRRKMFVSLFQIRRQNIFDPFHECTDSARQIAPMCYDKGNGERPATKVRHDLHQLRSEPSL
jgi:hypothetical protein